MKTLAIIAAAVALALLAWDAGEQHYQSCVAAAQATGIQGVKAAAFDPFDPPGLHGITLSDVQRAISKRAAGCSRLPF